MNDFWDKNLIIKTYRGSLVYGTYITHDMAKKTGLKESDKDIMGVCIPPKEYFFGLNNFEQYEKSSPDEVIYSLRKYIQLASQCNPNIIEMLYVSPNHIIHNTPLGQKLIDNRNLFLSKRVKHTYAGYAYSQMQKLKSKKENTTGRKDLVERFSYDTKFAYHVVRLLSMGIEALVEGTLNVDRPNKNLLMDIRCGKYNLSEINEIVDDLNNKLELAYINSELPNKVDYNKINKLCIEIHEEFFGLKERLYNEK